MSEASISSVIAGSIVAGVGWIWIVITAFRESKYQGLFCLLPLYAMYYGIRRWSDEKQSLLIASVGVVILIIGIVYGLPKREMEFIPITLHSYSDDVEPVIAEFMEAGAERNIEAAYACWSPESASEEDIAEYIESNYDDLFAGYKQLSIKSTSCQGYGPEGISFCDVEGSIRYSYYNGGKSLLFEAWLVKENEVWNITAIRIGCVEAGIMC